MDIKYVIHLLRGVAEMMDNNSTYNLEDTLENNLFKITVPDYMEEAQTMRFQIMTNLKAWLSPRIITTSSLGFEINLTEYDLGGCSPQCL